MLPFLHFRAKANNRARSIAEQEVGWGVATGVVSLEPEERLAESEGSLTPLWTMDCRYIIEIGQRSKDHTMCVGFKNQNVKICTDQLGPV